MYRKIITRLNNPTLAFLQGLSAAVGLFGFGFIALGILLFGYSGFVLFFETQDPLGYFVYHEIEWQWSSNDKAGWLIAPSIAFGMVGAVIMSAVEPIHRPLEQETFRRNKLNAALCRYEIKQSEKGGDYVITTFEDRYEHFQKQKELKGGEYSFNTMTYSQIIGYSRFWQSLMVKQLKITDSDYKATDEWGADTGITEITEIDGLASLSIYEEGTKDFKKNFHKSSVPTLSSFGSPKTSLVRIGILKNDDEDAEVEIGFVKMRGYMTRGQLLPVSIGVNLSIPSSPFDKIIEAIKNDSIESLTFNISCTPPGFYQSQSSTNHFKILFKGDEIDEKSENSRIFDEGVPIDRDKLANISVYGGKMVKVDADGLGHPTIVLIRKGIEIFNKHKSGIGTADKMANITRDL